MAGLPARTRSFTLVQVELPSASTTVIYQSPADRITLVKTWTLHNLSAASANVSIGVRPAEPALAFFWAQEDVPAGKVALHESWFVLEPLDEIIVSHNAAGLRVAVYGTSLRA